MSDIHQEWKELRKKNGDFINHQGSDLGERVSYLETVRQSQAKEIKRLQEIVNAPNGSCSPYTQQGMQSKISKQANEIRRLTGDNIRLKNGIESLNKELNEQTEANARLSGAYDNIYNDNKFLQRALETSAEDAKANFNRGRIKGMKEIWKELVDCYIGRPIGENNKIFGYYTVGDILLNLSPAWFMLKAEEYHKQEEKKEQQAKDIQIGDEIEVTDKFDPDLDDFAIVIAVYPERRSFEVIGPKFEGCFDETDILRGNVKKTGRHFDSIPLDYFN